MSFTALTEAALAPGKPVTSETENLIRTNFDDHESRIEALEAGNSVTFPAIIMRVSGDYSAFGPVTRVTATTTNFSINITGVRLIIDLAGTSGSTSIDIKKKSGAGAWTSILTVQPSVAYTAGDDAVSSNGTINASQQLVLAGDLLRLDITGVQVGAKGFTVRIDYVAA